MAGVDEAVLRNIDACKQLSAIVRTSIGPNGMNKMVVNHLGQTFVTSDAATIVRELEVIHPAAKLVVMASQAQEKEVGDGTGLVVAFAGELLEQAEKLLRQGMHTPDIVSGKIFATFLRKGSVDCHLGIARDSLSRVNFWCYRYRRNQNSALFSTPFLQFDKRYIVIN